MWNAPSASPSPGDPPPPAGAPSVVGALGPLDRPLTEARDAYEKGLAAIEPLAARDPLNTMWQRDLAISNERIGLISQKAGNMDGAFVQLFASKAAAVGANSQLVEGYTQREGKKFKVLWSSPPLHDLALMHSARVPAADAQAVARAFLGMHLDPRGRDILEAASKLAGIASGGHFAASNGSEYGAYRDFYRTAPPQLR